MITNFFEELKWRGMIYDSSDGLDQVLQRTKLRAYIGFDPSASSLHVGSLLPIMGLVRLQKYGHTPIAVVGGGTGMIGDPSGKTAERQLLTIDVLQHNLSGIKNQLSRFIDFEAKRNPAMMVNNADWLLNLNLVEFLREIGKHFTIGTMISKESVKRRLTQEDGLSFTEFSYMLLQAYDYLMLYDSYQCTLQMGGSDQWGNIIAGMDLIRRLRGGKAFALVFPLVTTSSGIKFGKTEAGTIWLDPKLTTPYRFYQFWLNTDDKDAIKYLKLFTLLSQSDIAELESSLSLEPHLRGSHKRLANEVTKMVHGETELLKAQRATGVLFGDEIQNIDTNELFDIFADVPSSTLTKHEVQEEHLTLVDLLKKAGFADSNAQAYRLIKGGGAYINNRQELNIDKRMNINDTVNGQLLILRKGKKSYHLFRLQA